MSEKTEETLENVVGPQLATDPERAIQGKWDIRKLTRFNKIEILVKSASVLIPPSRGGRAADRFWEEFSYNNTSEDGWNVHNMIRMIAGSKGASYVDYVKKPGWAARNLTDRQWRERAEREGQEIIE